MYEIIERVAFGLRVFLYEENHAIVAWFHKALAMSQLKNS